MKNKASVRNNLGYSSASVGDAVSYTLVGMFLMFFLTTVAKIDPAKAGIITALGAVWNAFFNPLMGFFADRIGTKFGRRRPLIIIFSVPLALSLFMLFTDIELPDFFKPIYYGIVLMLFWTSYTGFFVPYLALGAEYTSDYDERTLLRLFASLFNMIGNILCMIIPTAFVGLLVSKGASDSAAWSITGAVLGFISFISILVTFFSSKQKDPPCRPKKAESSKHGIIKTIFGEYISVAMLKPMRYLIAASTASLICYAMLQADVMYFYTYNLGLSTGAITFLLIARPVLAIIFLPLVGKLTLIFDKRKVIAGFYLIGAAVLVALRITGVTGKLGLAAFVFGLMVCTCVYWQLMPSIYYDVCDYDRLETGKARQGTIVSFQGLIEAVAVGIGSLILGTTLKVAGFDGSALMQSETAMSWIFNCTTVIPIIFELAAATAILFYPIGREKHAEILERLDERS